MAYGVHQPPGCRSAKHNVTVLKPDRGKLQRFAARSWMTKMKKATILCLCLLMSGAAVAMAANGPRANTTFPAFWQKFKTAVISGNKESVSSLSRFPLEMSYGIRTIKNSADLRRRYR